MWIELDDKKILDLDCFCYFCICCAEGEHAVIGLLNDGSKVIVYSSPDIDDTRGKFQKIRTALLHKFSPIEGADLLLKLIADLTLADHLGDVASSVSIALDMIGLKDIKWGDLTDLGDELGKMGVTTLLGVDMTPEEE